jgi:formylglycine-generating enzyme required for sulfatase activity
LVCRQDAQRSVSIVDRFLLDGDNEHPAYSMDVAAFSIETQNVTNARYQEFVNGGGYRDPQWWRAEDWAWIQRAELSHPLFWAQIRWPVVVARNVRVDSASVLVGRCT